MSRDISQVFPTIASLHLELDVPKLAEDSYVMTECLTGLNACLVAMRNLQDLQLRFSKNRMKCFFDDIFGTPCHVWPLLSQLELGGMRAEEDELVEFFIKHPIQTLNLSSIWLFEHRWTIVLDTLRMAEPKLETVVLTSCITLSQYKILKDPKTGLNMDEAAAQYSAGSGPALETIDWVLPEDLRAI